MAINVKRGETLERIWANTTKSESGCWLWNGAKNNAGYPYVRHNGRMVGTHRVVYRLTGHDLHPGDAVNHRCHVRACVNPDHLNAASTRENTLDALQYTALNARIGQLETTLADVARMIATALGSSPELTAKE